MATNKRKSTTASSSSSYDMKLFISVEVEDRFYYLPDIDDDGYSKLWEEGLHKNANAMHYFISAKLLSSKNISGATKERATLNYAILNGLTIDVGKVI
ncbi:hypothetical protein PanWU01x14_236270 [Parasponia andersonii]|uniref:Uncharacterized protein n=1 Tax=Parasponia andersonii TaxID=3476 RepID=A0A2P5BI95_PARAD|nr:hypothetical protein PanWU01x14_236270 [Parasponia andersonii]